jgi:chemotaxis family two-component system response regulator Rcp1
VLVVEDNKADVFLIREALTEAQVKADIRVIDDGEKAMRFFTQSDSDDTLVCPALIILDINLPRRKGGEILRHIRDSGRCANVLVLVVTSSDSTRDREEMEKFGIAGYFRKPSEYAEFMKLGPIVKQLLQLSDSDIDSSQPAS